jgi:uncharacterized membrane protein required for colicin V production
MTYDPASILPGSNQTVFFDWISIAYLVVVVVFLFIGIKKGFLLMLLSFAGVFVALLVAFFVSKPMGTALAGTSMGKALSDNIYNWLVSKNAFFSSAVNKETAASQLPAYFEESGVPSILVTPLTNMVVPMVPDVGDEAIGIYMAQGISSLAFIAGSFILIFIVVMILVSLLKKVAGALNKVPVVGWVNRLLGALFGVAIGFVYVCVFSYGMTFFVGFPTVGGWITSQLRLTDDTMWSVGKMLYEQNFVGKLYNWYLSK